MTKTVVEQCMEMQLSEIEIVKSMYTSSEIIFGTETTAEGTYYLMDKFTIKMEHAPNFIIVDGKTFQPPKKVDDSFSRIWIWSHHIFSESKRKHIASLGKDLKLNGIIVAGRPGFIIVEGIKFNVDAFWSDVKTLSWKKIHLLETDNLADASEYKFSSLKEVAFQTSANCKTVDAGQVKELLTEIGLGHRFNMLYSLD